jgi:pantoate--beta-alanine ligase
MRLNEEERSLSVALHQSLLSIKDKLDVNNFKDLITNEIAYLESLGFKVDYLEMATKDNLEIIDTKGDEEVVLLIAAYIGNIRLIDNITF